MIKDRSGKIIPENSGQNRVLQGLYGTLWGRCILKILTLPAVSGIVGAFMDSPLSVPMIQPFIKRSHINMRQYRKTKYRSYNDFFTRKIKPQARPIDDTPEHLISPCDSKLTVYDINENRFLKIKDSWYSLDDLLQNKSIARRYRDGKCLIFRLCVDDYHRYCYIDDGSKTDNTFIKGELHTVNPIALEHYNIYKRNSREYTMLHTKNFGDTVQIEVGAMLVGRICNRHGVYSFRRGEEKGLFKFGGSTIVLLFEKNTIQIDPDILENSRNGIETAVKYGEKIGTAIKNQHNRLKNTCIF